MPRHGATRSSDTPPVQAQDTPAAALRPPRLRAARLPASVSEGRGTRPPAARSRRQGIGRKSPTTRSERRPMTGVLPDSFTARSQFTVTLGGVCRCAEGLGRRSGVSTGYSSHTAGIDHPWRNVWLLSRAGATGTASPSSSPGSSSCFRRRPWSECGGARTRTLLHCPARSLPGPWIC